MPKKHYLLNSSVSVYGLVLDIEYYYTPEGKSKDDLPVDDPEVEINTISWKDGAGTEHDITDVILALDRAEQGKVNKLHSNSAKLTWQSMMDGIVEAIEQSDPQITEPNG